MYSWDGGLVSSCTAGCDAGGIGPVIASSLLDDVCVSNSVYRRMSVSLATLPRRRRKGMIAGNSHGIWQRLAAIC